MVKNSKREFFHDRLIWIMFSFTDHCVRMDWVCLNWNTSSKEYYKRNGDIYLTKDEKVIYLE